MERFTVRRPDELAAQIRTRSQVCAGALSRGRPRSRRGDRAANLHHAHLPGRKLGAFRLAGGEPRHARLRSHQRRHVHPQGLVRAPLAGSGDNVAPPVRAAHRGGQPHRPADSVQRHLPYLRPHAEVAAGRQLPALHAAVPRRRILSRHRVPQGQKHLRPRLLRRPLRRRTVRSCGPAGDVCPVAGEPDRGAALSMVRRQHVLVLGHRRPARRSGARRRGDRGDRRAFRAASPCSMLRSSRSPTTRGCRTHKNFPTASASTRARRRSDIWRSIPAPTCTSPPASPTMRHSRCRKCRSTPISECMSTATARAESSASCRRKRPLITASCRCSFPT